MVEETRECLAIINLTLDGNPVSNGIIVFTRIIREGETETLETYKVITNKEGNIRKKLPYGEYNVHAEYTSDETETTSLQYFTYDSTDNFFLQTDKEEMHFKLYRCENEVILNKECKYFLHEPYMTPNNYDLYFNYSKIPVNNIIDSPHDLRRRLQRKLPLTKILHLNLESAEEPEYNTIHIRTGLTLSYNSRNTDDVHYHITGVWDEKGLESKMYSSYVSYVLEESTDKVLKSSVQESIANGELVLEDYPFQEQLDLYDGLIDLSFDGYVEQEQLSLDSFKEDVTVYVVRVNNEETIRTYTLTNENGFEIYTDALEVGEVKVYGDNEACVVSAEARASEVEEKLLKLF